MGYEVELRMDNGQEWGVLTRVHVDCASQVEGGGGRLRGTWGKNVWLFLCVE